MIFTVFLLSLFSFLIFSTKWWSSSWWWWRWQGWRWGCRWGSVFLVVSPRFLRNATLTGLTGKPWFHGAERLETAIADWNWEWVWSRLIESSLVKGDLESRECLHSFLEVWVKVSCLVTFLLPRELRNCQLFSKWTFSWGRCVSSIHDVSPSTKAWQDVRVVAWSQNLWHFAACWETFWVPSRGCFLEAVCIDIISVFLLWGLNAAITKKTNRSFFGSDMGFRKNRPTKNLKTNKLWQSTKRFLHSTIAKHCQATQPWRWSGVMSCWRSLKGVPQDCWMRLVYVCIYTHMYTYIYIHIWKYVFLFDDLSCSFGRGFLEISRSRRWSPWWKLQGGRVRNSVFVAPQQPRKRPCPPWRWVGYGFSRCFAELHRARAAYHTGLGGNFEWEARKQLRVDGCSWTNGRLSGAEKPNTWWRWTAQSFG